MYKSLTVMLTLCFASIPTLRATPAPPSPSWQDQQQQDQQQQDQQQNQQQDQPQYQVQDQGAAYENFSPDQLDNLLSPIALYPDPLLAQVFVAATFPDQIEEAARYVREYGEDGIDDQDWDVSVKAVAHYPTVVEMMADKIDWTTSLGQAYVNQSADVGASVQHLRHMARDAGNLDSSQQQEVIEHDNYIAINPYQPEYIYVPVYDPAIIYYRRPYYGPAITFGVGFPIGAWLNLDFRWGYGGGWGGVYYTGWQAGGWGAGCWNCGWIGRSRGRVDFRNSAYINNRYRDIRVNRAVVNRTVNVNNINRYNSVHRDARYNNVQTNNARLNRNGQVGGNVSGNYGRQANQPARDYRPAENNKIIDRNIDRGNPRIDQYRGRDNINTRSDRPPAAATQNRPEPRANNNIRVQPRTSGQTQARPAQPSVANGPHTFNRNESHFDPRVTSQRGQASRQQATRPQPAARPPAQPRGQSKPHDGGERKKP
ncbi:MAG: DUF3300 domain-containing protein [Candidatus Acidiferrales bacterium]